MRAFLCSPKAIFVIAPCCVTDYFLHRFFLDRGGVIAKIQLIIGKGLLWHISFSLPVFLFQ